ncbi:MAG: hypothetical protein ABSC19_03070 [Syntrophorhabdales bacterium]|jgi:hypothetical protein
MKIGKIMMLVLLAGVLLVAAGTANATTTINIYGCSAQFFLWSSMNSGNPSAGTPNFLADTAANGGAACSSVTWAYDSAGTNYFWASGTGCSNPNIVGDGSGNIVISVAYKTSNDAIWSVNGVEDPENTSGSSFCAAVGGLYTQRKLASGTVSGTCNSGSCTGTSCTSGTTACTNTATCQTVTLGASDEKADFFTQVSWGNKYGVYYTTSNPVICREFGPSGTTCINGTTPAEPAPSDVNLAWYNPIADPTAFYVNKAVTEYTCVGGTNAGDMCNPSDSPADCGGGGTCTQATITNISRMMAAQIFTGQAKNWSDLGGGFTSIPIWACMRHTGAGTNITFDYAVLGHDHTWLPQGAVMLNEDSIQKNTGAENVYFYDTITSQLACVNGEISSGTYNSTGSAIGAIGYTDADRSTAIGSGTSLPNVVMLNYNGILPSRRNVRNGVYDFWSKNYLYFSPTAANCPPSYPGCSTTGTNFTVFDALTRYASNPAMITALPTGKGNFWAAIGTGTGVPTQTNYSCNPTSSSCPTPPAIPTGEMYYMKAGADILPGPVTGNNPNNPQNP